MRRTVVSGVIVLGLAGLFAVGCGGGSAGGWCHEGSDRRAEGSWRSHGQRRPQGVRDQPDAKTAKPGSVTFKATNKGTTPHELIVVKSTLRRTSSPSRTQRPILTGMTTVTTIPEMAAGKADSKVAELTAGKYLLICNVPAHYQAGMTLAFTVQ